MSKGTAKVLIVSNEDDWEGIYINGRLASEGHRMSAHDILDTLKGYLLVGYEFRTCDREWLLGLGNLPDSADRIRWQRP